MKDIPTAEASALLSQPLLCADAPSWSFNKIRPGLATLECGLIQEDGSRAGMHIQLIFSRSTKTGMVTFKFTVYRMTLGAPLRVYQVHVNAAARAPKNWHDLAHEHMGDARTQGTKEWLAWGFAEALDYFSRRANITFIPSITDPEHFELTP